MAKPMKKMKKVSLLGLLLAAAANPLHAQVNNIPTVSKVNFTYADIADLVTIAPMAIDLKVRKIRKLPDTQTVGVPDNIQRVLAEADVITLLRGPRGIAARQRFLIDLPKDTRGKVPNIKKQRFFVFARPVAGRTDMIQLARPDALVEYSAETNQVVRDIIREAVQKNAPAKITGVSSAFHSPSSIIGEGETQIFLNTETDAPFGISVTTRGDTGRSWTVSTSEVISDAVPAPRRATLLWYRLACGLPVRMPADVTSSSDSVNAAKAMADYRFVRQQLGQCSRTRPERK